MSRREEIKAIGIQAWLIASRRVGLRRKRAQKRRVSQSGSGNVLVFCLHGFMAGGPVFDPMRDVIEATTGARTTTYSYGPLSSFEGTAQKIAQRIQEERRDGERLVVLCHSLGGLLARHLEYAFGVEIDLLITLATPHAGTETASIAPGPMGIALRPGSRALRALPRRTEAPHIVFVAEKDTVVSPLWSSFAIDNAKICTVARATHNSILYDARVTRRIVERVLAIQ